MMIGGYTDLPTKIMYIYIYDICILGIFGEYQSISSIYNETTESFEHCSGVFNIEQLNSLGSNSFGPSCSDHMFSNEFTDYPAVDIVTDRWKLQQHRSLPRRRLPRRAAILPT